MSLCVARFSARALAMGSSAKPSEGAGRNVGRFACRTYRFFRLFSQCLGARHGMHCDIAGARQALSPDVNASPAGINATLVMYGKRRFPYFSFGGKMLMRRMPPTG
jgi:hypothetical protein